jgi:hypothetical protein
MEITSDEARVRQMFDEMTVGQPDAPPDRHMAIGRRARRHRLTQAVGTVVAAAAVAAVAVGVAMSASPVTPTNENRPVPGWALPWPDHRNGSVPQQVLDGAVTAWRHQAAPYSEPVLAAPAKVIWYVGQTVARGQVVAVIFEVDGPAGPRLVAGLATASDVMRGQPAWTTQGASPWVLYNVRAPRPTRGLLIGLNVPGTTARPSHNPDNWVVLLAAPQVESVTWTAPTAVSSDSSKIRIGIATTDRGLAAVDAGQITGPVVVDHLYVDHRNTLASPVTVGVPGSEASQVPQLAAVPPIPGRPGFTAGDEFATQGNTTLGMPVDRGRLVVRARCYGHGQLRLTFSIGGGWSRLGTVTCDDLVHELMTSVRVSVPLARLTFHASPLTAYRVVIGTVR